METRNSCLSLFCILAALFSVTSPAGAATAIEPSLSPIRAGAASLFLLAQAQPLRGLPQSPTAHLPSARQQLNQQRSNQRTRFNNRALMDQMERRQNMQRRTYPNCASATTAPCQAVR